METLHNISTARNKSHIRTRVRSVLTLVGIVTAIICSLVFLKEIHSSGRVEASAGPNQNMFGQATGTLETSNFVNADLLVNIASTVGLFKKVIH